MILAGFVNLLDCTGIHLERGPRKNHELPIQGIRHPAEILNQDLQFWNNSATDGIAEYV
jgi:hypothetical protein